jgi:hypothetical protein
MGHAEPGTDERGLPNAPTEYQRVQRERPSESEDQTAH